MKVWLALLIVICASGVAVADAPEKSRRPLPRPALVQPEAALPTEPSAIPAVASVPGLRPQPRPAFAAAASPAADPDPLPVATLEKPRKGLLALIAPREKPAKKPKISAKGSVCGVASIKGQTLPRVTSKTKSCGIDDPVSVTSIDGVRLSQAATMDCPTAIALNSWVQKGLRPAFGRTEVVELKVAAHYICRSRNNVRGAKISEHGRGKAIDISAFVLSNGKEMSVQGNFDKTVRTAHKAACGIFKTTLGPGSDGYHEDHLHFDTSSRKGGAYCR